MDGQGVGGHVTEREDRRERRGGPNQVFCQADVIDGVLIKLCDGVPLLSLRSVDRNELVGVWASGSESAGRGTRDREGWYLILLINRRGWGARCGGTKFLYSSCFVELDTEGSGLVVDWRVRR